MVFSRLFASLFVLGILAGLTLPAFAQDDKKDKDKDKKEEKKDGVTLKWKFEKDKVFYQTMKTETKQSMKVMNNDVTQTQNQTFFFKWKTLKVEADSVDVEQEIIGVKMEIDIGGTKITYDSTAAAQANNPLGDFFKALVGSKFVVKLDTKAGYKVISMTGREDFIKRLVAANPGMRQLLDTILSEKALTEMAEPTFAIVPAKAVTANEKWTKKTELDMGPIGKYNNTYEYTYEKLAEKGEQIAVKTTLEYVQPDEKAGQGGLPFKIKSAKLKSSNPVGQIFFDNKKGRVAESLVKLELKGELAIEIGGQTTTVTLSQVQESTTTTSDDDPLKKAKG